jgi:hypothetical protein
VTDETGSPDDISTMAAPTPPTAPPTNFAATGSSYSGPAPTAPPTSPRYQPDGQKRRRPVRTVAGVAIAVLVIVVKLAIAFGAGHLVSGSSGPVVIIVVAVLILFGFLTRFMRF